MVLLRNLGSGQTVVNGVPVRDAVLGAGDQLVFDGQHRFVVEFPAAPAEAGSEAPVPAPPASSRSRNERATSAPIAPSAMILPIFSNFMATEMSSSRHGQTLTRCASNNCTS